MQQKETLSAYMDGYNVNGEFTDTLCRNTELQQQWANYHTIRSVIRGEELLLGADFSAKMADLIENETIEKTPNSKIVKLKKNWHTSLMQIGIAASVCLATVIGVTQFTAENEVAQVKQPVLQTLPFSDSVQPVSYNSPNQIQPTEAQLEQQQRRINSLLQNHELQRRTLADKFGTTEEEKQKNQTSSTNDNAQP